LCPITSVELRYNEKDGFNLEYFKNADNLPLTKFTISNGTPCLIPHELPNKINSQFTDELTRTLTPCTNQPFYGGANDPRYIPMAVDISQR